MGIPSPSTKACGLSRCVQTNRLFGHFLLGAERRICCFLKLIKSRPRRKCKIINSNHCCCFLSEVKFELKCFYEIFPQMPSCRITRPKGELISQKSGRRFTFLTKSHRRPIDCRPTNARTLIYMPAGKFVCKHCHQACRYNLGIDRRFYSSR